LITAALNAYRTRTVAHIAMVNLPTRLLPHWGDETSNTKLKVSLKQQAKITQYSLRSLLRIFH